MAQRETEETTELKVPEASLGLCAGDCAFPGNPIPIAPSNSGRISPAQSSESAETGSTSPECGDQRKRAESSIAEAGRGPNRCFCCRKRVRLTGFRCRCGELFCGVHRYSDRHVCTFDYKAAGREEIARANPVVRAAKITRI